MRSNKIALLATSLSLVSLLSISIAGCASTSGGSIGASAGVSDNVPSSGSAVSITADDITRANVLTAFDAVDRLHRRWFHEISGGSSGDPAIYINGVKADAGKDALRQIPAQDVARIDYLKASDAIARFGATASGGAILVTRK